MISLLIRFILIAGILGVGAMVVIRATGSTDLLGGLASKNGITEGLEDKFNIIDAASKVLPAVTEIPSLLPLINTKDNIQRSVEGIINLPAEEKAAFCKQVCSP